MGRGLNIPYIKAVLRDPKAHGFCVRECVVLGRWLAQEDPNHPEQIRRRQDRLRSAHAIIGDVPGCWHKRCEQCDGEFFTTRAHARWCSVACRVEAAREKRRKRHALTAKGSECLVCDQSLRDHPADLRRFYCSGACRQRARRIRARIIRNRLP